MIRRKLFERLIIKEENKNIFQFSPLISNKINLKRAFLSDNLSHQKERPLTFVTFNDSSLSNTFRKDNNIIPININNTQKKFKRIIYEPQYSLPKYEFLKKDTERVFTIKKNNNSLNKQTRHISLGLVSKKSIEKYNYLSIVSKTERNKNKSNEKIPEKTIYSIKTLENKKEKEHKKEIKKRNKLSKLKYELSLVNNPQSIIYPLFKFADDIKNGKSMKYIYKTNVKQYKLEMEKAGIPAFKQVFMLKKQMGIGDENKIASKLFSPHTFMDIKF